MTTVLHTVGRGFDSPPVYSFSQISSSALSHVLSVSYHYKQKHIPRKARRKLLGTCNQIRVTSDLYDSGHEVSTSSSIVNVLVITEL